MHTHTKRGAALLAAWVFIGCGLIAFFLPFGSALLRLAVSFAAALLSFPFFFLRLSSARFTVKEKEFCVARGVLFLRKKRLPIRYLTGLSIFRTPLQRVFGLCTLTLYASGSSIVLFCLDDTYARALYTQLVKGGASF